ncbi:MAG TPA: hypothetical protein VJH63_04265 [Candidatus Paceibacterota bacterium]
MKSWIAKEKMTEKTPTLNKVMAYQNERLVKTLQRKLNLTRMGAILLFEDLKRFLYLCAIFKNNCAPTPKIDKAWHEFILNTRDYADFNEMQFGLFLHHRPGIPKRKSLPLIEKTKDNAKKAFGDLSSNWNIPANIGFDNPDTCDMCV